ncbi:MAG: M36 family metallopeptidase [Blastocatellia bacterium]|nr:M36 family metallopeptidase [Blastocatellia bacterium]
MLDESRISEIYRNLPLNGLNNSGYLDGQYASSEKTICRIPIDSDFINIPYGKNGFAELMIYYYIDYTQRYIQKLGFEILNKKPITYDANANSTSHYSNGILFFNSEVDIDNHKIGGGNDAEIIVHEYGHAIQDYQIPGFGKVGESGAIAEGFADYLAASVTAPLGKKCNDTRIGYTCIGEWRRGDGRSTCRNTSIHCLRKIDPTTKYDPEIHKPDSRYFSGSSSDLVIKGKTGNNTL